MKSIPSVVVGISRQYRLNKLLPSLLLLACGAGWAADAVQSAAAAAPATIEVRAGAAVTEPLSGRLLVFVKPGSGDKEVDTDPFHMSDTWVAAKEVRGLASGGMVKLNADEIAFPEAFSKLPAGQYEVQAVLDVDHSYNYGGRNKRDWISDVVPLAWTPGAVLPPLTLDRHPEENPKRVAALRDALAKVTPGVAREERIVSTQLSRFWGRPIELKAWVILPPGYDDKASKTYPTAYWTHGFGGNLDGALTVGLSLRERMDNGQMPPMIWVMLDESVPQGTHEFADSANNGPWGAALTTEFLPYLEGKYKMDARRNSRLLNGHSSGGWATLQLQVNYPKIFGGTWSTSPDSSDFHDFTGPDLYAPHANMYRKPDGSPYPIMRMNGKVVATLGQFAQMEDVVGPYGGQFTSFDWVFSPKGEDGRPQPMFDRRSGNVDPQVVAYWRDHYDLAHIVQTNWAARGADLRGRIHLYVGTADTFYLDGAAHRFQAVLDGLGADAHFTYIPDRSHFDLYAVDKDSRGLINQIAAEMYATARPAEKWTRKVVATQP
jgi:hypothetical protein